MQYTKLPVQWSRWYVVQIIIRPREDFQRGVSQALIDYMAPPLHLGRRWGEERMEKERTKMGEERWTKGERREENGEKRIGEGEEKRM